MADLSSKIETNAQKPKQGNVDGTQVEQLSIDEQIKADEYLKSKAAANSSKRGFVLTRFHPGERSTHELAASPISVIPKLADFEAPIDGWF